MRSDTPYKIACQQLRNLIRGYKLKIGDYTCWAHNALKEHQNFNTTYWDACRHTYEAVVLDLEFIIELLEG